VGRWRVDKDRVPTSAWPRIAIRPRNYQVLSTVSCVGATSARAGDLMFGKSRPHLRRFSGAALIASVLVGFQAAPALATFGSAGGASTGGDFTMAGSAVPLVLGVNNQPLNALTLTILDGHASPGDGWAAGDSIAIAFSFGSDGLGYLCSAGTGQVEFPALPQVSATSGGAPFQRLLTVAHVFAELPGAEQARRDVQLCGSG
jgi:hypothetical protein